MFKYISDLQLWWSLCLTEWNHLYHENNCQIILKLDQWCRGRGAF